MGHCQLLLEVRGEGGKPGKVKAKRFVVPVITAASCAVLVGLPNPLPLLLSYWGISVRFKLVLKNSQACGSCTVTLQWKKDLPKISCTGSPQIAGHRLSTNSPSRLPLCFASCLALPAGLPCSKQLAAVTLFGDSGCVETDC